MESEHKVVPLEAHREKLTVALWFQFFKPWLNTSKHLITPSYLKKKVFFSVLFASVLTELRWSWTASGALLTLETWPIKTECENYSRQLGHPNCRSILCQGLWRWRYDDLATKRTFINSHLRGVLNWLGVGKASFRQRGIWGFQSLLSWSEPLFRLWLDQREKALWWCIELLLSVFLTWISLVLRSGNQELARWLSGQAYWGLFPRPWVWLQHLQGSSHPSATPVPGVLAPSSDLGHRARM